MTSCASGIGLCNCPFLELCQTFSFWKRPVHAILWRFSIKIDRHRIGSLANVEVYRGDDRLRHASRRNHTAAREL